MGQHLSDAPCSIETLTSDFGGHGVCLWYGFSFSICLPSLKFVDLLIRKNKAYFTEIPFDLLIRTLWCYIWQRPKFSSLLVNVMRLSDLNEKTNFSDDLWSDINKYSWLLLLLAVYTVILWRGQVAALVQHATVCCTSSIWKKSRAMSGTLSSRTGHPATVRFSSHLLSHVFVQKHLHNIHH